MVSTEAVREDEILVSVDMKLWVTWACVVFGFMVELMLSIDVVLVEAVNWDDLLEIFVTSDVSHSPGVESEIVKYIRHRNTIWCFSVWRSGSLLSYSCFPKRHSARKCFYVLGRHRNFMCGCVRVERVWSLFSGWSEELRLVCRFIGVIGRQWWGVWYHTQCCGCFGSYFEMRKKWYQRLC